MSGDVLQRPTLVLNRHWRPVHVTSVVRALVLLWNDSARVVEPEEYRLYGWDDWAALEPPQGDAVLRTTRGPLRVPEVVCLTRFDRLPATAVTFSRRNVARRDHYICQYCGDQPGWEAITIDHVVPRSRGGATSWQNCVAACPDCNGRKADRTPEQAGMRLRKAPARPAWKPLFSARSAGMESWAKFLEDTPALAPA
jgi:5-methylcytosine-specific restriction endonuclease McrA